MEKIIENLKWRSAVKVYDPSKKVSESDLNILKEVITLAPTSYGLQFFKVLIVENPKLRGHLQNASWGQKAVVDASHFIVFANYKSIDQQHLDDYFENYISTRNRTLEQEEVYKNTVSEIVHSFGAYQPIWTAKQTYLVLGFLMQAAAELKIDVTPMEGFDPKLYNEILGLDEQNLNASVVVAIGYRDEKDYWSPLEKVRKTQDEIFVTL